MKSAGSLECTSWQQGPRYYPDVASGWQEYWTTKCGHILSQAIQAANFVTLGPVLALNSGVSATVCCQSFSAHSINGPDRGYLCNPKFCLLQTALVQPAWAFRPCNCHPKAKHGCYRWYKRLQPSNTLLNNDLEEKKAVEQFAVKTAARNTVNNRKTHIHYSHSTWSLSQIYNALLQKLMSFTSQKYQKESMAHSGSHPNIWKTL